MIIDTRSCAQIHDGSHHVSLQIRDGLFGNPGRAVEMDHECCSFPGRAVVRNKDPNWAAARTGNRVSDPAQLNTAQPVVCPRSLYHGRRILTLSRSAG